MRPKASNRTVVVESEHATTYRLDHGLDELRRDADACCGSATGRRGTGPRRGHQPLAGQERAVRWLTVARRAAGRRLCGFARPVRPEIDGEDRGRGAGVSLPGSRRDLATPCGHPGAFWSSLFVHDGQLYLLGTPRHDGPIVIRRSGDGGKTWTEPKDKNSGLLFDGNRYHCAPVPVVVDRSRIWRAVEDVMGPDAWWVAHFRARMISAPQGADLLKASSWTATI